MQDLTQRNRLSATVVLYHSGVDGGWRCAVP